MNKKDILKLFKKYGFDSSLKEPFLYEEKDKLGIYYTFKDEVYGVLNRVYLPKSLEDCEWFLKNYYIYQSSHCNLIKLSVYNDPYAEPKFVEEIEVLDENNIVNLFSDEPLYESAKKIIKVIEEKMNLSLLTYENVKKLTDKYTRLKQEVCKKKNIPIDEASLYNPKIIIDLKNEQNDIIKNLNNKLNSCYNKEEIKKVIDELIVYLKSLELEDSLINNKYFMLKIPILNEQLKEEIKLLDEYNIVKIKKKKKIELDEKLKELDEKHAKNKVISLSNFIRNEHLRINEKYEMINDIDYDSIADYLIEFDNLDIKDNIVKEKQGLKLLNEEFNKLDYNIQNKLYLYTFFYNSYLLKDVYKTIINPSNILVKIKLFKDFDISSLNNLELAIKGNNEKIKDIAKIEMPCDIVAYFEDSKILKKKTIMASSKKSCMPRCDCENPCKYFGIIRKGSLVNFVPSKLIIDYTNDDKIVLKEGNPLFIVDIEKNNLIKVNNDIIKVAKVKILEKKTTDYVTVSKIKTEDIICYKKFEIERKENNG